MHTFRVKVSGRIGGRTRSATKKVRWTIDVTPPSAPVVSGGSAAWTAGPVTITGSGSTDPGGAIARYEHRTSPDGSTWSPAAAGGSLAVISPGQTFVQVRAVDTAGNASAWAPAVTRRCEHGHGRRDRPDDTQSSPARSRAGRTPRPRP